MPHAQAHYDIVYVARTPQQSAEPTLAVLGPVYGDLEWSEDLYNPTAIEITASTDSLEDDLKSRLRDLVANPTEIWVYRNGTLIAAGPILGGQINDRVINISAGGLLTYLKYMIVESDVIGAVDQATLIKDLVDAWQATFYGDFGIDTSGITAHSEARTVKYIRSEWHIVYDVMVDLGAATDGFDAWIDPDSRELTLDNPSRGSDLSASVFLERGITSPNVKFSVAPGIIASESFGQSKDTDDTILVSSKANTTLRQTFGRVGYGETYEAAEQGLLDDLTQASLDVRDTQLFVPGPGLLPVDGAQVEDFTAGDTVNYLYDAGIGQQDGQFRVKTKKVNVEQGHETMEVEFE